MTDQSVQSSLAQDLLRGVEEIAAYTGETVRRQRHLIAHHNFPHMKAGGIIVSRRSWCDEYYSRWPDQRAAGNGGA
jgi:hypothetical protein